MNRMWSRMLCCMCAVALAFGGSAIAQEKKTDDKGGKKEAAKPQDTKGEQPKGGQEGQPSDDVMKKMFEEMSAPNENHKLLGYMVGEWDFVNKFWMDPKAPPQETKGTCSTKPILGGRFFESKVKGEMMGMPFEGIAVTGYDKQSAKFVNTWIDNFGTGIMKAEGTYDPSSKSYTYFSSMLDPMNNNAEVKVKEVIRVISPDQHAMDWYEQRGGEWIKTMEITYSRKKAG